MLRALLIFLAVLLGACQPFPQQPPRILELPETYHHVPSAADSLPDFWWEVFADPQLNQLENQLLAGNLDLRQAIYRLEQLDALLQLSGATLWPTFSLQGSASRDHGPTAIDRTTSDSVRVSLAAQYEIDLWNRLQDKERAAELRLQAGAKETQTLLLSLTATLAENYFQAVEKQQQLTLARRQIETNQALLAVVTDLYRAGLATAEEVYRAQNLLAAQQARLPQLQTALHRNQQAIALLLGRSAAAPAELAGQLPEISPLPEIGVPANLLTNRPDVAATLLQLRATDSELAAALADRLPSINLTATLGQSSSRLASGDISGVFWNIAAAVAQPLFDGGRRQAEVDRQRAVRNEQLAALEKSLLIAVQEVEIALTADQNAITRYLQLTRQEQINARSLALNRENYRSGLISSSQLLAVELEQLNILSQQLTTRQEWLSSRISLARALGGQWLAGEIEKQQKALKALEDES